MNAKTCRYCAHWERDRIGGGSEQANHCPCRCPKIGEQIKGDDVLSYSYSESGWFETGPDFGCVHFTQVTIARA